MGICRNTLLLAGGLLGLAISGCVIAPREAKQEQARLDDIGRQSHYTTTRSVREIPDLPLSATLTEQDVLRRALLANGELEAAFHEWAMAVARIDQAGTWPTQPLELGFDYMFSAERMKTFDRMTFSAAGMDATPLPNKTYEDATGAYRLARAAGERFRQAKFDLQARVLVAWTDYALQAERIRIQTENVRLLRMVDDTAATRVRAGGAQQELLKARVELRQAENELATLSADLLGQRAALNALLVRPADAPLPAPTTQPGPRPVPADDAALLALGVRNSPELAALDAERLARESSIRRARMEYQPEFNLSAAFTGSVSQAVGGMVVIPTRFPAIRAMIAEARADLRRTEAMTAQTRADRGNEFAAHLVGLRDAERRVHVFTTDILPLAERSLDLTRRAYASGSTMYLDVIEAQRTLLDVRLLTAEARATRERMLAELERLAGADIETLSATTPKPKPTELTP